MDVFDLLGIPNWLLCTVAIVSFSYLYFSRNFDYWKSRGIPEVPSFPIVGSVGKTFLRPFQDEELDRYKKYGRLYGAYEGSRPVISVADPDLLRNIFVKDFLSFSDRRIFRTGDSIVDNMVTALSGEDWKRVRTIITPAFTSGKLKKIASIILESADTLIANFEKEAKTSKETDIKRIFGTFTMDVLVSSSFGTRVDSYNDPSNPLVLHARNIFNRNVNLRFVLFFVFPSLMRKLGISPFPRSNFQYFIEFIQQVIQEKKKSKQKRVDLLQIMLDAANESVIEEKDKYTEDGHEEENAKIFQKPVANKNLSLEEVVAQCVLFLIAGYDTSASTLSFIAYHLALNPDCQEKLIREVDEVVGSDDDISYDTLAKCKYLDQVVSETLRISTPGIRGERMTVEDYELGDTGITIPKGMIVTIPIHAIHHDEQHYPDPEQFDPERFTPENKAARHPYSYLPFGAGPRNCIGMRFALMEVKLSAIRVFRRFRFKPSVNTKVPLEYFRGQQLLQPKQISLKVELRTDIPSS